MFTIISLSWCCVLHVSLLALRLIVVCVNDDDGDHDQHHRTESHRTRPSTSLLQTTKNGYYVCIVICMRIKNNYYFCCWYMKAFVFFSISYYLPNNKIGRKIPNKQVCIHLADKQFYNIRSIKYIQVESDTDTIIVNSSFCRFYLVRSHGNPKSWI